jgi:hypothetical protein
MPTLSVGHLGPAVPSGDAHLAHPGDAAMSLTPRLTFRRVLVASALSALVATGAGVGPASAESVPLDCQSATAQVGTARAEVLVARAALNAANQPLGRLVAVERQQARTEARTSRAAIHSLQAEIAATTDEAVRSLLRLQVAAERADVRHSARLLSSKTAMLAHIKSERAAAKATYRVATGTLVDVRRVAKAACATDSGV